MVMFSLGPAELLRDQSGDVTPCVISVSPESISFMHHLLSDGQSSECLQFIKFITLRFTIREDKAVYVRFWLLKNISTKSTQIRGATPWL